jgi:hypothetical protein
MNAMLTLTEGLLQETLTLLRGCGRHRDECVVYWSGRLDRDGLVDAALHPSHWAGPGFYEVDARWLNDTWVTLARTGRTLRAQVHTHTGRAFHSASDDMFPVVAQAGFLSLVLPHHAMRDDLHGAYLCRLDDTGCWQEVSIARGLSIR